jgi:hypothetical protein
MLLKRSRRRIGGKMRACATWAAQGPVRYHVFAMRIDGDELAIDADVPATTQTDYLRVREPYKPRHTLFSIKNFLRRGFLLAPNLTHIRHTMTLAQRLAKTASSFMQHERWR